MQTYEMLAAYNQWANRLVYDAAANLTEEELHHDTGVFFGSIFGTLSHLVTADRIWLNRFTGEGPRPLALNERPCGTLAELRGAREAEDERIIRYVEALSPEQLAGDVSYTPMTSPTVVQHKLWPALTHVFNHQTHHRGQVHAALTSLGKPSLSLDLIYFARLQGQSYM